MSDNSSIAEVVKNRIDELEQAIQQLDFVKKHLNQNSSEIKSQIHASISRQLETLRNRELWLLEQVEGVVVGKEEVLQRQQARLNKALGILHSGLAHAELQDTPAKHLVTALQQLNNADLKAEETPYIAFRADHVSLRESILSYGRVDAKGMPLLTAFADEDQPSASLPPHLEEYEDSEHHIFYKHLHDLTANSSNVRVMMPKLSSRVEDWLQRPVLQLTTCSGEGQTPSSETPGTPVSQTTCAIQNWLSQIKHNPDGEEDEDFEIVDRSSSSQRESPLEEDGKPVTFGTEEKEASASSSISKDLRRWLLRGGTSDSGAAKEDLMAFFKHITKDPSAWLLTAHQQLESLDDLKLGHWFRHIPSDTATWLRRAHDKRGSAPQPPARDMLAHIPRDDSKWLKKEPGKEESVPLVPCMDLKWKKHSIPRLLTPLKSIPNVMEEYAAKMPSDLNCWLLKSTLTSEAGSGSDSGIGAASASQLEGLANYSGGNSSSNNNNAWLCQTSAEAPNPLPFAQPADFFSHISRDPGHWLLSGPRPGAATPRDPIRLEKVVSGNDDHRWLIPASSNAEETSSFLPSPLEAWKRSHDRMSASDWLLGERRKDGDSPASSEKSWTVCSAESSPADPSLLSWVTPGAHLELASLVDQKFL